MTIIEMQIERHEKLHAETEVSIKTLSDGINKLIQSEIRREQDNETFARLFTNIEALERDFLAYKDAQTKKEIEAYKGLLFKVLGIIGLVVSSAAAGHFAIKIIG